MFQVSLPMDEKRYLKKRERVHFLRKVYVVVALFNHCVDFCVLFFLFTTLRFGDGYACCSTCSAKTWSAVSPSAVSRTTNGTCFATSAAPSSLSACSAGNSLDCFSGLCDIHELNRLFDRALNGLSSVAIAKMVTTAVSFISLAATTYQPLKHSKRKLAVRLLVYLCTLVGLALSVVILVNGIDKKFVTPTCAAAYSGDRVAECKAARSLCSFELVLVITSSGTPLTLPAVVSLINAIVSGVLLAARYLLCRRRMAPTFLAAPKETDDLRLSAILPNTPFPIERERACERGHEPAPAVGAKVAAAGTASAATSGNGGGHAGHAADVDDALAAAIELQGPSMTEDEFLLQMALAASRPAPVFVSPYGFETKPMPPVLPFGTLRRGHAAGGPATSVLVDARMAAARDAEPAVLHGTTPRGGRVGGPEETTKQAEALAKARRDSAANRNGTTPRGKQAGGPAPPPGAAVAAEKRGRWACLRCTAHNKVKYSVCRTCGTPQGQL